MFTARVHGYWYIRPDQTSATRGYTCTRSLPVRLPLGLLGKGITGLWHWLDVGLWESPAGVEIFSAGRIRVRVSIIDYGYGPRVAAMVDGGGRQAARTISAESTCYHCVTTGDARYLCGRWAFYYSLEKEKYAYIWNVCSFKCNTTRNNLAAYLASGGGMFCFL